MRTSLPCLAFALLVTLAACADDGASSDADSGVDAGGDVGTDAGDDTAPDDAGAGDTAADGSGDVDVPAPSVLDFAFDEPGPYPVGYRVWETTYTVPGTGEARTIPVHAWYPAAAAEGTAPRYLGLQRDEDAYTDAPVAVPVDGVAFPVHVYSHGDQGFAGTSAFLMRYFASHGWLVVAPDHIGNLLNDNSRGETDPHWVERPSDITAALDAVEALPEDDPLAAADTTRVLLSGHSRGAYTVWSVSGAAYDLDRIESDRPELDAQLLDVFRDGLADERVVASIPLAGDYRASWFGDEGWQSVDIPILFLTGSNDGPESMRATYERVQSSDIRWVELEGGCHQSFALGACDTLDVPLGFSVIDTYAMAFARHEVLGDDSADVVGVLDGSVEVSEVATLSVGDGVAAD